MYVPAHETYRLRQKVKGRSSDLIMTLLIMPLVKDKLGDHNKVEIENHRGITLTPLS